MTAPFYAEGLRWSCVRCSYCCRHETGYVFLSKNDLQALAAHFKLAPEQFIQVYCRWILWNSEIEMLSLKESSNNDCFFWKDGCSVYAARPAQCRTYPFWENFLKDEKTWLQSCADCPGAGKGELRSKAYIEACIKTEQAETPLARRRPC